MGLVCLYCKKGYVSTKVPTPAIEKRAKKILIKITAEDTISIICGSFYFIQFLSNEGLKA